MPLPPKIRFITISDTQSGAYYLTVHAVRALFSNRRARCLLEAVLVLLLLHSFEFVQYAVFCGNVTPFMLQFAHPD